MARRALGALALTLWLVAAQPAPGASAPATAAVTAELPRTILYLMQSSSGESEPENDGDQIWATPLNYLGLRLAKVDVSTRPPPPEEAMGPVLGVIAPADAWSSSPAWCSWVARQLDRGRRVLVLASLSSTPGSTEASFVPIEDVQLNEVYRRLGLHVISSLTSSRAEDIVAVRQWDRDRFGYEAPLEERDCRLYMKVEPLEAPVTSLLTLWWKDIPGSESDVVCLTPTGGFAVEEYLLKADPARDLRLWRLDPIRFLEAVFGVAGRPRPEINLINGSRTYFSHVDGDGFTSYSEISPGRTCGQVLLDEIFRHPAYGRLPVTVSLIGAEVDPATTLCIDVSRETAQRIFALPTVEVAAHGYAHPMDWVAGVLAWPDLPVGGAPLRFDRRHETLGALALVEGLAPPGKKAKLFLWTGSCNPDEAALGLVEDAGYGWMNGGDTRYDGAAPTLTAVAPPARTMGRRLHVNAQCANDYLFTNSWTEYDGFRKCLDTFERSGAPRLLLPVNVYYHFYAGERAAGLGALKTVLNWVLNRHLAAVTAREYVDMVRAARAARLGRLPGGGFWLEQSGLVPTLRFDGCRQYPDLGRSRGVIGYRHLNDALYLYLDGSTRQEVFLADGPPAGLLLLRADRPVRALRREGTAVRFATQGPPDGSFRFQGLDPAGRYAARVLVDGTPTSSATFVADNEGRGHVELRLEGRCEVVLEGISAAEALWVSARAAFWGRGRFIALLLVVAALGLVLVRRRAADGVVRP